MPRARPSRTYLDEHGWRDYELRFLGVDNGMDEETKGHYEFPYGDVRRVHRCGVISAESRAAQYDHPEQARVRPAAVVRVSMRCTLLRTDRVSSPSIRA
jgi:hypothetical protein